jgi:tetratricopeptide (TPR) repeat protein
MLRTAVCFLVACVAPARAADATWVEVRSPNFSVFTDAGEKRGREVALRFEQMRVAFGAFFRKMTVNFPVPLQIIAFRNNKELERYAPIYNGKPVQLAGFYLKGEDRNFIALDLANEAGWSVVFHEYAHLLMNGNLPPMPVWFDEGLAEYCASLQVDNKQIKVGLVLPSRAAALDQMRWMHTADLLAVAHDSKVYNEGDLRSVFYSQSWLTVHYFMSKGRLGDVGKYLNYVKQDHLPIGESFQRAFGITPGDFDKELQRYFRGNARYFFVPTPPGTASVEFTARPAQPVDVRATLADLHYHSRDYQAVAVKEFEEVLRDDPENFVANRGLGYAYLRADRLDAAAKCFRRAAAHDDHDPRLHFFVATLLFRQMETGNADADAVPEMKKELETAVRLDPGYADAYHLLGMAHARSGDMKQAIAAARKATELSPRNDMYAAGLVTFYLNDRDLDAARPLLARLAQSDIPQIAEMARANAERLDEYLKTVETGAPRIETPPSEPAPRVARESVVEEGPAPALRRGRPETADTIARTVSSASTSNPSAPSPGAKIEFVKGRLVSIDCSAPPAAVLTVSVAGKTWKMAVRDTQHVLLIGADGFSCSWTNRPVAVNYRAAGEGRGDVFSLELQ